MRRLGIYLGFAPEGGGAFQYAQSILTAAAALPVDGYQVLAAYSHPAWSAILACETPSIPAIAVPGGSGESLAWLALRSGFPLPIWHRLARRWHRASRQLLAQECDAWVFPAQDLLSYAYPGRSVGVIHDLMHRHEPQFPEVSDWGLYQRRERHYRNLCGHASAVLVDSEIGQRQARQAYPVVDGKLHVLPYVAPSHIYQQTTPSDFDKRYTLPSRFLFYPAQFWQHKNHVRLLQALAKARMQAPDLHLVLAGSRKNGHGPALKAINELGLADRVQLLGYVPDADMAEFYRRALALVMPTFFGPTNIPPLEAMATGCPMALSDIYAMREQSGEAALYFDPRSVEQIADAIVRLACDAALRERLSTLGRLRAREWGQAQFDARFRQIIDTVVPSK